MNTSIAARLSSLTAIALLACRPEATKPVELGQPLAELNTAELRRFRSGEILFNRVFTPTEGLGPLFNDNQCSACHTSPATGGTGEQFLTKATRFTTDQRCELLGELGGENVRRRATPLLITHGVKRQPLPGGATERARFSVPFVFGLGLIEAIPEAKILRNADPTDKNRDGISGRPGADIHGRFARFGRKADQADLRDFVESAAHLEMGLTTPNRPREVSGALVLPAGVDPAPDPELDQQSIDRLVDFVLFLAPPRRQRGESQQAARDITRGEELFHTTGCAACHTPTFTTGMHESNALRYKRVDVYSDLLLHDMGAALANVCGPAASPTEQRTAPLMGIGHRELFLHDSRTNDLTEAILLHGGEATNARERFRRLHEIEQAKIIRFLRSL